MNISFEKNAQNSALINVGDATFFVFGNIYNEGSGEAQPEYEYHIHAGFEVQYIKRGKFIMKTEFGDLTATQGDIILIPPNSYHQVSRDSGEFSRYCFSFSIFPNPEMQENSQYLKYNRLLNKFDCITTIKDKSLSYAIERIIDTYNCNGEKIDYTSYSWLTVFLMELLNLLSQQMQKNTELLKKDSIKRFNHLNERQKYIIENCLAEHFNKKDITETIEKNLNTSKRNATRIVYNMFGENISDLVLKYRMRIAKMYIENTDIPLNKISEKIGYGTYAAFFIAFKKYYGISPLDYREHLKDRA